MLEGAFNLSFRNKNTIHDFFTWTSVGTNVYAEEIGNLDDLGGDWSSAGVGDYNGDGKDEILWCNGTEIAYGEANQENFTNLIKIA